MVVTTSRWYECETWILASDVRLDGGAEGLVRIELFCAKERSSRRPSCSLLAIAVAMASHSWSSAAQGGLQRPNLGAQRLVGPRPIPYATTLVTGADGEPLEKDAGRACVFDRSRTGAIYT